MNEKGEVKLMNRMREMCETSKEGRWEGCTGQYRKQTKDTQMETT